MTTHTVTIKNTGWEETTISEIEGGPRISRAHVTNTLDGDIVGTGVIEYLMMYVSESSGPFVGYERIEATLDGKNGSFCVTEEGTFDSTGVSGTMTITPGTATGDLTGITGRGSYRMTYGDDAPAPVEFEIEFT